MVDFSYLVSNFYAQKLWKYLATLVRWFILYSRIKQRGISSCHWKWYNSIHYWWPGVSLQLYLLRCSLHADGSQSYVRPCVPEHTWRWWDTFLNIKQFKHEGSHRLRWTGATVLLLIFNSYLTPVGVLRMFIYILIFIAVNEFCCWCWTQCTYIHKRMFTFDYLCPWSIFNFQANFISSWSC